MKTRNITEMQDMPIYRILFRLSWPVVLSMFVQSFYTFVDSIYLSKLGDSAMSAVSLSFTVQNFTAVFFTGIATGMNVLISRFLGAGDYRKARDSMYTGCMLQFAFSVVVMALSFSFVPFYFSRSTSNPDVILQGTRYLLPCMGLAVFSSSQIVFERVLQASGLSGHMLLCQIVGSAVNIILDPVLIFGLGPFGAMGIRGAAVATLAGQLSAAIAAIILNIRKNSLLFGGHKEKRTFDWKYAGLICYIGIPSSAVGLASSISGYFVNRILIGFSSTANAAFGVYAKLENIAVVPGQGCAAGLVTLLSFYIGQKNYRKMRKAFIIGELTIATWMIMCAMLFILAPRIPLLPFSVSEELKSLTIPAVRIVGSTYILSGFMIGLGSFYQAVGKSIYTLVVAASRQLLVRIPIAFWLASFGSISLIWWCWPISEVVSDAVNLVIFSRIYKKTKIKMSYCGGNDDQQ